MALQRLQILTFCLPLCSPPSCDISSLQRNMAASMVGGALLGAAFNVLLDRFTPELDKFFRGRKHDHSLLKKLKLKLLELTKVLDDAEDKQITNQAVKEWVDELKDAIYDAEDLVDEIATEALRCKVEAQYQSGSNKVQSLISSVAKFFDHEIESKLQRMIDRLEDFTKAKDALGLREVSGRIWYHTRSLTNSVVVESCIKGRENDREEIMKLLLSDGETSNSFDVIPIVGMGGLGKTTLARLLFNDCRLDGHFLKKAWVCVSDMFDGERVVTTIVNQVTGEFCDGKDPNSLAEKLKESLRGIKFFIVLDDVWHEKYEDWDTLMTPLKFGARGSKIIVTTRHDRVASIIPQSSPMHRLQLLPEEYCLELFFQHAFEKGDQNAHPNLESIGKEIVKKCKGLPLAAKTLGGLLRSERDIKGWNNILESAIWELSERSNILPALSLSYHYLPSQLKRCFAYCSIFSKDYEFDMKELVSIWIAEGFLVQPKKNKTVEEEGYEFFRELLSRSFFQKSNADDSHYVMHDLVHDLAQYVMGDFSYRLEDDNLSNVGDKVRHFSYDQVSLGLGKFKGIGEAKCLRTFLPSKPSYIGHRPHCQIMGLDKVFLRSKRLRLLSLSNIASKELLCSIGNFIYLRFLDLSRTETEELPQSICMLCNLETFLLSNNHGLTTLPADFIKLISLRHLNLSGTSLKEMPMHFGRLKDLLELTVFVVGKCNGAGVNELGEFHSLQGTISISGLQNVKSSHDALEAKIGEKRYLERLVLEWNGPIEDSQNAFDIFEKLKPKTSLKHLEIKKYGGTKFPPWLGDQLFRNMVSLSLKNCENCFSLPALGQLPSLKKLVIGNMPGIISVGHEFYGESDSLRKPFQSLESLHFIKMKGWVDWCILDAGEFSQLQKLQVVDCPKLIACLPPIKMPALVALVIVGCPGLEASISTTSTCEQSLKECQDMQLEWERVPSIEKLRISSFSRSKKFPSGLSAEMSHCYTSLETLYLESCERLKSIQLGLFPKLRVLRIWLCGNLETLLIPDGIELRNSTLLEILTINDCPNMLSFPCGGLHALYLSYLRLHGCDKLKALPDQMHTLLPSLESLEISECPEIESFPEGGMPSKLSRLHISNCKKLVGGRRDWDLQTLPSLTSFELSGESEDMLQSFPEEGLLPSTLTDLRLGRLPDLKSLNGRGLQLLGSLEYMQIVYCPELQSFSVERLPTSLSKLVIRSCPLLEPRCRREDGEDWHKIAHIPFIQINSARVQ